MFKSLHIETDHLSTIKQALAGLQLLSLLEKLI